MECHAGGSTRPFLLSTGSLPAPGKLLVKCTHEVCAVNPLRYPLSLRQRAASSGTELGHPVLLFAAVQVQMTSPEHLPCLALNSSYLSPRPETQSHAFPDLYG